MTFVGFGVHCHFLFEQCGEIRFGFAQFFSVDEKHRVLHHFEVGIRHIFGHLQAVITERRLSVMSRCLRTRVAVPAACASVVGVGMRHICGQLQAVLMSFCLLRVDVAACTGVVRRRRRSLARDKTQATSARTSRNRSVPKKGRSVSQEYKRIATIVILTDQCEWCGQRFQWRALLSIRDSSRAQSAPLHKRGATQS